MNLKNYENKILIGLLILTGLLLATPHIVRFAHNNPYSPGSETYHYLRLYNSIDSHFYDKTQNTAVGINLFYLIPFKTGYVDIILKLLPILLGISAILLTHILLKRYNVSYTTMLAILVLLIISPIFIYIFTTFNFYSIIIVLNLLGLYFLVEDKYWASIMIFAVIPFISFYGAIISLIFLIIYFISGTSIAKSNREKYFITGLVLFASLVAAFLINTYLGYNVFSGISLVSENIITDIGADIGFSFSVLVLSAIGLILLWEKGWKNALIYSSILLLVVISFFNSFLRIYLNFIIVMYAGFAFIYLLKRKWSIALIKKTTLLLIVCSIMFSTIFYTAKLVRSEPTPELVSALSFVNLQSFENETIYSSADKGFYIEYFSNRSAFIDSNTRMYDPERIKDFQNISNSRNLENTEKLLKKYNIKYVFIDPQFKQKLENDDGLLFLMEHSEKFAKIYENNNTQVWIYGG